MNTVTLNANKTIQLRPNIKEDETPSTVCFNFLIDNGSTSPLEGRINKRQIEQLMIHPFPKEGVTLCLANTGKQSNIVKFTAKPSFDFSKLPPDIAANLRELEAEQGHSLEAEQGHSKGQLIGGALVGLLVIGGMVAWFKSRPE